jgi:hypothetical protein
VSEREHPAAKAGRFVRAAGRAGRAAAREFEREQRMPVPASHVEAREPLQPPPPARTGGVLGVTVFVGFLLSLLAIAVVGLGVETLVHGGSRLAVRLVAAAILFAEATLLTSNWRGSSERLGQRLLTRVWGPRAAVTRRERGFARVVRDALTLIGIVLAAAGLYTLLNAALGS